jgi:hypothetical protein
MVLLLCSTSALAAPVPDAPDALMAREKAVCWAPKRGGADILQDTKAKAWVVGQVGKHQVVVGRTEGGHVAVFTPHALDPVGFVKKGALRELPSERCRGEGLYQPAVSELLVHVRPAAGGDAGPLAEHPDWFCFAPAKGRKDLVVHENYIWNSPEVGRVPASQVFIGEYVEYEGKLENKVLVQVPGAKSWVGIARRTETRRVPLSACQGDALYRQ